MPRDSNGNYSLPSGYLAVPGDTIQASQHNPPLEDLASSMTDSLPRSGIAPMSGVLKLANGTASSPGLAFNSSQGTGLFKTTNGIGVAINGAQVGEFTAGGLGRIVGELIPWTRTAAPAGWLLPYGQTLNRTDYPALWAVAQAEIAAGNIFYNNGNGTTTFGIGDLRGRSIAAPDNMGGGSDPNRLTNGALAGVRNSIGGAGGESSHALAATEIPVITSTTDSTFSQSVTSTVNNVLLSNQTATIVAVGGSNPVAVFGSNVSQSLSGITSTGTIPRINSTSNNTGGQAHNNMQPTILCYYALYAGA